VIKGKEGHFLNAIHTFDHIQRYCMLDIAVRLATNIFQL